VFAPSRQRMESGHDITVERARLSAAQGGRVEALDPVGEGRVTLLTTPSGDHAQAVAALDELVRLSQLNPGWKWSNAAIIAREWRRLEPVRSYAEHLRIPVERANESLPSIWRLREMQMLIRKLLPDRSRLLTVDDLLAILNDFPTSRWTNLIGEGSEALSREIDDKFVTVPDLIQWLGEWARDARGRQRGLLLLTAHRAKGLEFDHAVIMNGGWDRPSRGEDPDAPRRLFYVAMTRARQSLTLLTDGPHAFVRPDDRAILRRSATPDVGMLPQSGRRYVAPDPRLVFLSFAGHLAEGSPSLQAISRARVGDPVFLRPKGAGWVIRNEAGQVLGRMSRSFEVPARMEFLRGEVAAILCWNKGDGDEEYNRHLRRDEWEVVLPELVFGSC